jgi:hypothetical protein
MKSTHKQLSIVVYVYRYCRLLDEAQQVADKYIDSFVSDDDGTAVDDFIEKGWWTADGRLIELDNA